MSETSNNGVRLTLLLTRDHIPKGLRIDGQDVPFVKSAKLEALPEQQLSVTLELICRDVHIIRIEGPDESDAGGEVPRER